MDRIFALAELAVVIGTLLPFSRSSRWWVRTMEFPRVQIAALGAALLGADLATRTDLGPAAQILRVGLALCVLYQLHKIRPYTLLSRRQVQTAKNPTKDVGISLMLANVLMQNRNAARLREIIAAADPDVFLAVETDRWWQKELAGLAETHPYTVQQPQENTYGMVLFSKLELIDPEVRFLVQDDIPSIRARVRMRQGTEVEIHCLHPRPPVPQETQQSTERDAELMLVGKEVKDKPLPIVVLGDLNDVAWSETNDLFQKVSGLLDPRIGRGLFNSFHARYGFLRFPLDHFFHSAHFRLIRLVRLPYFGSDHFPMYIQLSYEPEAEAEHQHEKPKCEPADEAEASEKINEAASGARR